MPVKDLHKATDTTLKSAYEQDYKTEREKKDHVHRQVYQLSTGTEVIGTITYPVLNVTSLRPKHGNVAIYLLKSFAAAGVRPDTPFHENKESKYPAAAPGDSYRYMEYNTIGGGMRLIYDVTLGNLFLSAHYSDPVVIRAGAGTADAGDLATVIAAMNVTQGLLKAHSEDMWAYLDDPAVPAAKQASRRVKVAARARTSPAFIAWLRNKNSAQVKSTVLDWYNVAI